MRHKKEDTPQSPMITAQEADAIRRDKETLENMAGAGEMSEVGYSPTAQIDDLTVDKEAIRAKIRKLETQLDSHRNQRVTDPNKRSMIVQKRKELENRFRDCLESFRDLGVTRRDSPDWGPAYKKALERHKYDPLIHEWKRLGLMLEPEDPSINDLDKLRRD